MATAQVRVPETRIPEWTAFDGLVQLISVDGQRTVGCPYWDLVADVDADDLRHLYRDMVVVRRIDAEAMALQRQGELALWAPLLGQEAAQVGRPAPCAPTTSSSPVTGSTASPTAWASTRRRCCGSGGDPASPVGTRPPTGSPRRPSSSARSRSTPPATRSGITLDGADSAALTYFGDGATSEGDVAEAFGFAASYGVPVVFFCQNNQWAISEPVRVQSHASIAERGQGYGIPGIQVDGNDVLAVLAATRLALARASAGSGPDAHRGRHLPHGPAHDFGRPHPLPLTGRGGGVAGEGPAGPAARPPARRGPGRRRLRRAGRRRRRERSPPHCAAVAWPCPTPNPQASSTTSTRSRTRCSRRSGTPTWPTWPASTRTTLMATMSLGKALNSGLRRAMERDPKVVLMGEDIGKLGGVFRVTEGLQRDFGDRRVIDTPLAESGVIGTAVGLAMRGYRPVCEIQFDGFVYPAFDQIVSQVAKLRYRNEGRVAVPLTIRIPFGGGVGAVEHHSESPEAYFAHTAGLRVVTPSNAADGYRMIQQAIASDDPVVFFEPKRRYWDKGEVDEDGGAGRGPAAPGPAWSARART